MYRAFELSGCEMRKSLRNLRVLQRNVFHAIAEPSAPSREPESTEAAIAIKDQDRSHSCNIMFIMDKNIPLDPSNRADRAEQDDERTHHITGDLSYKRLAITNVVFVSARPPAHWVLVDTGIPGSAT